MPTTQPLDPGDDAEGQLKPIAEFSAPAPSVDASRPIAAKPAVAAPPVTPKVEVISVSPTLSRPGGATTGVRTTLHAPSLSLNRKHVEAAQTAHPQADAATHNRKFTDAELTQAWTNYIDAHATDRLLVNTMRVSLPQRTATENVFEMVVESEIQVELINEALPALLASLRSTLGNDLLAIHVRANNGASSPLTWNEREILSSIIERHPTFRNFVDDLGLTLL